jgi:nucleotide-binding universal stress UspA family protein
MEHILVGVDGSPESKAALEWAIGQAEAKSTKLRVVMVVEDTTSDVWIAHGPLAKRLKTAHQHLDHLVKGYRDGHPKIVVEHEVREGRPAEVLLDESKRADLLVVGGRGRGALAGALLGSVSLHCVAQSSCPVVVVRCPVTEKPVR